MNVKYVNPFLMATKDIVSQVLGSDTHFDKPYVIKPPINLNDMLIIIDVNGEMNGKVMMHIDKTSCINIASQMMGGMPAEFNDLSKSAVSELFNMILGTTATNFANEGIKININSPTVLEGVDIKINNEEQMVCVPVSIPGDIKITVNISTEKKAA